MTFKHECTVIKLSSVYVMLYKQLCTCTVRVTVHYDKVQLTLTLYIIKFYNIHYVPNV